MSGVFRRSDRPASGWEALTRTEWRIVALVIEGLTNPQIGDRLFVSPRTVSTHLYRIFKKVGVATRSELVSAAMQRGFRGQPHESTRNGP